MRWISRRRKTRPDRYADGTKRYSWVYCPACRRDLNGDNESFVEDTELVKYRCATCRNESEWLFDTPAPICIRINGYDAKLKVML